jgi:signal transduction histidine kinase
MSGAMTSDRAARRWAWGIAAATFASQLLVVGVVTSNTERLPEHIVDALPIYAESTLLVTLFPVLGALILGRLPRHPIGWVMCAAAATAVVDAAARVYAIVGLYLEPGSLPGPAYGAWVADWSWFPGMTMVLFYLPLLFPDGHPPSRRWRPVAIGGGIWIGVSTIGYALVPTELVDFPDVDKPVEVPAAIVLSAAMVLLPLAIVVAFGAVLVRRRGAVGVEREQMRWLIYAMAVVAVCWTLSTVLGAFGLGWGPVGAVLTHGSIALVPVAITMAILRHRLYDIDVVINRTLVYGALTGAVLGVYAAVVLTVTSVTPADVEWRWSVLVVAAVAVLSYPLREWLQARVNRLMYGDRDEPARAMSRLARRVADSVSPASLLPTVAETIGHTLRLPYVAVRLAGDADTSAATYGHPPRGDPYPIPLVHQGERVGTLLLGPRSEGEQFSAADLRVLEDVARQVAVAAQSVRLTEDLQRSRERLVLAREEERRRLRRDLHDGVGSALAGLALQAGNARGALPRSPDEARRLVADLEEGIRSVVAEIRRIVDDLRPPALDELGLDGALRERAGALCPGQTSVESSLDGTPLPAAVEVAAYRIGTEALTNASRHARSDSVTVSIAVDARPRALRLRVVDDGVGLAVDERPGVGLRSMGERAAEVGGTCAIGPLEGRGTLVEAVLPLPDPDEPAAERAPTDLAPGAGPHHVSTQEDADV